MAFHSVKNEMRSDPFCYRDVASFTFQIEGVSQTGPLKWTWVTTLFSALISPDVCSIRSSATTMRLTSHASTATMLVSLRHRTWPITIRIQRRRQRGRSH